MHILIAPNAFKNSLPADKAAEAINKGLQKSELVCSTTLFPVADGGDGTADLLIRHLHGDRIEANVHDPLGRGITTVFSLTGKDTAVIELANASGLRLLKPHEYDPLHATTFGTGELIKASLDKAAARIILCIGGSATVDGGTGSLQALGIKFLDEKGKELNGLPASLSALDSIVSIPSIQFMKNTEMIVLCDVENSLLGKHGAAAVFGPQKGASPADIVLLEKCLTRLRDVVLRQTGKDMNSVKHGGAAGGIAAALHVFFDAKLVNGIDYFLEATGFSSALKKTDMVITGEGSLDLQTLHGKGPFGVAKIGKAFSIPVIGMAGKISADKELSRWFDRLVDINDGETDTENILKNTALNLEKAAYRLGNRLAGSG
jgi:glycerate 2-kinase